MMKSNKEFAAELEKRTKKFAVQIISLASMLPKKPEARIVSYQMVKSGTSIGANYREVNRSVSAADFKNKISICTKEASETQYWLELIIECGILPAEKVRIPLKECSELLAIFTKIFKTCKNK
jgi:four helix bundle protein